VPTPPEARPDPETVAKAGAKILVQ
jgi:hypothetical protein